ncbi:MAG: MBL fold metallo-hydrolase [Patescibacteria group bacterium]|jgi:7,8-dihydropterin-6-yl-methyl-4-(beta-D-ribofuranosyl)aminobenzene 5'-phosphate synthase
MKQINITVLHTELDQFDNSQSGFSLLIETENKKILFDTSFGNDVNNNASKDKIDLDNVDTIVLSHNHWDHTGGLETINFQKTTQLIAHPLCFEPNLVAGRGNIGCPVSLTELQKKLTVTLTKTPYWLQPDNIVFLGEVPRKYPTSATGHLLDDSALVIKHEKGLIIITGCSHAGVDNIVEYAKQVCNETKIYAVIGGFHLFNQIQTDNIIHYLKQQQIAKLYPGHCLNDYALEQCKKIGGVKLKTLQKINL